MSEPRRLLEETDSATARALLHAGRSYRSSRETRAKTLAALGIAGSTAVMATGGSAAASLSVGKLSSAKLLVAVSAVGAVTLAPVAYRTFHGKPVAHVAAVPGRAGAQAPLAVPVPAPGVAIPAAPSTAPRLTPPPPGRRAPGPVGLAQELAALDAARATLARGDAAGALLLLDGYAETCPQGRLRLEAEVLRIEALARSGQTEAARRHARAFLRHHPGSVLAARARGYTGAGAPGVPVGRD